MKLSILRDKNNYIVFTCVLNHMKIVHPVIKRFEIQLAVSFRTVNINNIACEEFNNVSVYDIIRDKLFENNDMLRSLSRLNCT